VTLRTVWTRTLDVIFPPRCVGCGGFGEFICGPCVESASKAEGYRRTTAVSEGHAVFRYEGMPRQAVLSLKFWGVSALAPRMGELMSDTLAEWSPPIDAIVPVPLGRTRKRTRGYNQSELLAREIGRRCGLPAETGVLQRIRSTQPQTDQRNEAERRRNVRDAFGPGKRTASGSLLLIDDVTTTGATLDACAGVLLSSGAENVYALTFTRED
jgi:ComF family protein